MEQAAYAAALASVPGVGPRLLRSLLECDRPEAVWRWLCEGRAIHPGFARPEIGHRGVRYARSVDVGAAWEAYLRAGVRVQVRGEPGYPCSLMEDAQAPAVLFSLGDVSVVDTFPRVAIVGTRSATRYGLGVAAQLGGDLAAAGVVVVSGLGVGIDGAVHEGAVAAWRCAQGEETDAVSPARAAPPVAVVAGSVTTSYPRQHSGLWRRIAEAGAVLSEAPVGAPELKWRFAQRSRVMAALADVVVVVECHGRGGALHTVRAATARGVAVGAVPGSVRSPASVGTNELLSEGCFVVRDASDVLVAVELARVSSRRVPSAAVRGEVRPPRHRLGADHRAERPAERPVEAVGSAEETHVLGSLGWDPMALDEIVDATNLGLESVCLALEHLRGSGMAREEAGCWVRA